VGDDISVDIEAFLVTDFVNLKIKPAQSFRCAHRGRVYVHVFIGVSVHTYMSIYVCTVLLKKIFRDAHNSRVTPILCQKTLPGAESHHFYLIHYKWWYGSSHTRQKDEYHYTQTLDM
jgi:hypothetical protein